MKREIANGLQIKPFNELLKIEVLLNGYKNASKANRCMRITIRVGSR